ncbi:TIGR02117 family protein [uncultured Sphingomonas sp.]|uniref:TIGR02117 family protein n=1 Tax=uncultured Sphingomonas sp. TaxID=158754 RepID=UPI0035CA7BBD
MTTENVGSRLRVALKWAGRVAAGVGMLLFVYIAAGLIGGTLPVNGDRRPPARGVLVFVESNGVHTGLIVPKVAAGVDWRDLALPEHLADPRYGAYPYLSFGWGERAFYLETATWADARPRAILAAAVGSGDTLVHVGHLPRPRPGDGARPVLLRPAEYRRLAAFIRASVADRPRRYPGYGPYDAFYQARGRYSARRTCNAWTGEALAHAGVRVGRWTPFPVTVMWWF